MKREALKKLLGESATDETIEKIMAMHGEAIEAHKTKISDLTANQSSLATQLEEANKQIESFKGMDIESVKKTADEYKAKFEQATKEAADSIAKVKFDHALESALTGAKAKNPKAVGALLSMDLLKLKDDGTIAGLEEQLNKIKTDSDYLFESDQPVPRIVTGGNNQPVVTDAFEAAMWKGAGLKPPEST